MDHEQFTMETTEDRYYKMRWRVLFGLVGVVVVYLVLGAVSFHYLESTEEEQHKLSVRNFTQFFLGRHECLTEDDIRTLLFTYIDAYDRGIIEIANTTSSPNWDLASSVFFSITVITTIGYGNIYPVTSGGQAFCVIYAIIGIPLCLALLTGIGQKLRDLFKNIDKLLAKCRRMSHKMEHVLKVVIVIVFGLVCFLFLPAIMFVYIDGWSYSQALYYCVITLTTVGFGDLVPGVDDAAESNRSLYRIMLGLWIFVGLAWVAGVITFIQDGYTGIVAKAQKSISRGSHSGKTKSLNNIDQEHGVPDVEKVPEITRETKPVVMATPANDATEVDDLVIKPKETSSVSTHL